MVVWGGLTNSCKRREVKRKGEKESYAHLNAEFQRIAKSDSRFPFHSYLYYSILYGIQSPFLSFFLSFLLHPERGFPSIYKCKHPRKRNILKLAQEKKNKKHPARNKQAWGIKQYPYTSCKQVTNISLSFPAETIKRETWSVQCPEDQKQSAG